MKELIDFSSLDEAFGIEASAPIWVDWSECTHSHQDCSGRWAQFGNQWAKGISHKGKDFVVRLTEHRKKCRWWNDGSNHKFCEQCPGTGWVRGRVKGSLSKGNHRNAGTDNPNHSTWALTRHDGEVIVVRSLKSWCRENDIKYMTLYQAYKRKSKTKLFKSITKHESKGTF